MKNGHEWVTVGYEEEVKRWSEVVRKFRKAKGWTQGKFAKEIGVSFTSVNKYENGRALPAGFVKEAIRELLRKTIRGIELEDVIEMKQRELKKLFIKEAEKKLRGPKIIIRRRSHEMAQQLREEI